MIDGWLIRSAPSRFRAAVTLCVLLSLAFSALPTAEGYIYRDRNSEPICRNELSFAAKADSSSNRADDNPCYTSASQQAQLAIGASASIVDDDREVLSTLADFHLRSPWRAAPPSVPADFDPEPLSRDLVVTLHRLVI